MRPVSHRQEIAAPAAAVWAVISVPGHLEECHPFCAANPVDRWPGEGSLDRIEYYGGRTVSRRFTGWYDGRGFDIDITDANGPVAGVTWRLDDLGSRSALTISISPRFALPAPARAVLEKALVRPMLARYLRSVLAGIDWRVTTGRSVRRNQFGAHRWFSPAAR